jgi:hypothetical protein
MSTFSDFLKSKNIPDAQIIGVSNAAESLTPADRILLAKRAEARKAEKKYTEDNIEKPRSGRGVKIESLTEAHEGKALPRKVRSKIVKAINTILTRRGQEAAKIDQIFGKGGLKVGKKPVKAVKKK